MKNGGITLAIIKNDVEYLKRQVEHLNQKLDIKYVTQIEFIPIKRIIYGLIGIILSGFIGGLIILVFV